MRCTDAHASSLAQPEIAEFSAADTHRIFQHSFKYRLQFAGRLADDLQHFGGCSLALARLNQLAGEPLDLYFVTNSGQTTTPYGLWRKRLAALRFSYAACFGASSHCAPRGSGEAIVSTQSSISKEARCEGCGRYRVNLLSIIACRCPLWVKSRHMQCKRACPLYPQKRACAVHSRMSALGQ